MEYESTNIVGFICPYCEEDISLEYDEMIDEDYWGDVRCPCCGTILRHDDYELD